MRCCFPAQKARMRIQGIMMKEESKKAKQLLLYIAYSSPP